MIYTIQAAPSDADVCSHCRYVHYAHSRADRIRHDPDPYAWERVTWVRVSGSVELATSRVDGDMTDNCTIMTQHLRTASAQKVMERLNTRHTRDRSITF